MGSKREDISNPNIRKKSLKDEHIEKKKRIALKKRKRRIRRFITVLFTLLVVLIVGGGLYGYSFLAGLNNNNELPTAIVPSKDESVNVLIVGMDIGDVDNLGNESARRTDTIMVFNYNPTTKKTHIVSIPRDTMIEVDAYVDDGEYQRYWKINSAYALGGEEELINHVQNILGIDVNYMVEIDYQAFRSLVDAIGGVEMYIEQDMFYDDDGQDLHINFNAGETVHLDGKKAEEFFRWRKNNDGSGLENGDIDRIKNQQKLLGKIIEKSTNPSVIFKSPKIFEAISSNVDTNMTANEILSLGLKVIRLNSEDVIMTTLKGEFEDIYGQAYLIADEEANQDLINALNSSTPLSNEESVENTENIEAPSADTGDKANLKIMVLNATKINGLAGGLQDELYALGYTQVDAGNADPRDKSFIQVKDKKNREMLKSDTGIGKVQKGIDSNYEEYDVVIFLGKDYNLFGE